ncbi:MAG: hydroxymethylglutaryl-CoA lyase, partial [Baekduiaceae bacterium]
AQVFELVSRVRKAIEGVPVRVHLHNTRGTGIANAWAAFEAGAATLDASLGGIGGCPFAPGAAGNIATEDLVYLLEREGIATGVRLSAAVAAARWAHEVTGLALPGMVHRVEPFPPMHET